MNTSELNTIRLLLRMLTGDPIEAMESAKKLIGSKVHVQPVLLEQIASEKKYKKWSRIAAIYVLGFLNHKTSTAVLSSILRDRLDNPQIRAHAAEALGNLRDPRAFSVLHDILLGKDPTLVKRWCVYALSEIKGDRAYSMLKKLAATKPTGVMAKELRMALGGTMSDGWPGQRFH
jgi:HEAT repeat protein